MRTAPFLRWALERCCPLREHRKWRDPEQTERQLRALRQYSLAVQEGRLFEGVCVEAKADADGAQGSRVNGFQESEVFVAYGSHQEVAALCGRCPANAAGFLQRGALAGCHGLAPISDEPGGLAPRLSGAAERMAEEQTGCWPFIVTSPAHYGLWVSSPPSRAQARRLLKIVQAARRDGDPESDSLHLLSAALEIALTQSLPIHISLYPAGTVMGDNWIVDSHCPRCKASRAPSPGSCPVCAFSGRAVHERRRRTRGSRPYWPLANFLGPAQADAFLTRYKEFRRANIGRDDS